MLLAYYDSFMNKSDSRCNVLSAVHRRNI